MRSAPVPAWPPPLTGSELDAVAQHLQQPPAAEGPRPFSLREKEAFESAWARYCESPFAVAVNSGTTALSLAIAALRLPPGGFVAAANYGHPSSVCEAVKQHRILPVDVDPATLCCAPEDIAWCLKNKPVRCVVATHFAGQPANVAAIAELCREAGVPLIEDAAHAPGASAGGRKAGTFGAVGCFSFQATKNLTCGEGGALVTADEHLFHRLWRSHDIGRLPGSQPYDFMEWGGNYRLPEVNALLARLRLAHLDEQNRMRMNAVTRLRAQLPQDAALQLLDVDSEVGMHAYHLVATRYRAARCNGLSRTRFVLALAAEGIPCSLGWPRCLSEIAPLSSGIELRETPVAAAAVKESVWLDQRLLFEPDGVDEIVAAVLKVQALARTLQRSA